MVKKIPENQKEVENSYMDDVKRGLSAVENKERALNSKKMIEENKLKETKAKLTQQLFMAMKELGADPSNLESINEFLSKLSQQDPDLLKLFEIGFGGLQGEANVQQPTLPQQEATPDIDNNFSNLRDQAFNRV